MKEIEWIYIREAQTCVLEAVKKIIWFCEDQRLSEPQQLQPPTYWLGRAETWIALAEKNLQELRSL